MSANNHDASSVSTQLSFRIWRRRTVEQIMSRKDLSPIARLTAYSIAERLHQLEAIGAVVGYGREAARKSIRRLVSAVSSTARGLIIVGNRSHVFHHLHEFYPTWQEALRALTPPLRCRTRLLLKKIKAPRLLSYLTTPDLNKGELVAQRTWKNNA
jgi:hypothetical protein